MGKRGPKPTGKVKIEWSAKFAYAIGLIVSDGSLSINGRHIIFTSKDQEMAELFLYGLNIKVPFTKKSRSGGEDKKYFVVQFSDVLFYSFLESIGLTSNKSKTISKIDIPSKYFIHFVRGVFDGDGSTYTYFDKRWASSYMCYCIFTSASQAFVDWLQQELQNHLGISGHITKGKKSGVFQLRYAKQESLVLFEAMYEDSENVRLMRKYLKIKEILHIIAQLQTKQRNAQVGKLVDPLP